MAILSGSTLMGSGNSSISLTAGNEHTFTFNSPSSSTVGTTYFSLESSRNSCGFYDSTTPTYAQGEITNCTGIVNIVRDPYKFSGVLSGNNSSFTFTPSLNIPVGGITLRTTGGTPINFMGVETMLVPLSIAASASISFTPGGNRLVYVQASNLTGSFTDIDDADRLWFGEEFTPETPLYNIEYALLQTFGTESFYLFAVNPPFDTGVFGQPITIGNVNSPRLDVTPLNIVLHNDNPNANSFRTVRVYSNNNFTLDTSDLPPSYSLTSTSVGGGGSDITINGITNNTTSSITGSFTIISGQLSSSVSITQLPQPPSPLPSSGIFDIIGHGIVASVERSSRVYIPLRSIELTDETRAPRVGDKLWFSLEGYGESISTPYTITASHFQFNPNSYHRIPFWFIDFTPNIQSFGSITYGDHVRIGRDIVSGSVNRILVSAFIAPAGAASGFGDFRVDFSSYGSEGTPVALSEGVQFVIGESLEIGQTPTTPIYTLSSRNGGVPQGESGTHRPIFLSSTSTPPHPGHSASGMSITFFTLAT